MTITYTPQTTQSKAYYVKRHNQLLELKDKIDYAKLGEHPEIVADLDRIRVNVVNELREIQAILTEMKLAGN